jgi:hypothetical protein
MLNNVKTRKTSKSQIEDFIFFSSIPINASSLSCINRVSSKATEDDANFANGFFSLSNNHDWKIPPRRKTTNIRLEYMVLGINELKKG